MSLAVRGMTGTKWEKYIKLVRTPGVRAVLVHRFAHWLVFQPTAIRFLLMPFKVWAQHRMAWKWGIEISERARIGSGFRIAHYGGIFIGGGVRAGKNLVVSHDVTLGAAGRGKKRGAPYVGDNVYIAPGARVVGPVTIGDNVKIGANAVVDRDIPNGALVQVRSPQVVVFPSYSDPLDEDWVRESSNADA